MQKINRLICENKLDEALDLALDKLDKLNFDFKRFAGEISPEILEILRLISIIYYSKKEIMNSTEILLKTNNLTKQKFKNEPEIYAEIYADINNDLALNFKILKDYASALKFFEISSFVKKNLGADFIGEYAASLSEIAEIYAIKKDYKKACETYEKILEICKRNFNQNQADWAEFYAQNLFYHSVAMFYNGAEFKNFLNKSIEISKNFKLSTAKQGKFLEFLKAQK